MMLGLSTYNTFSLKMGFEVDVKWEISMDSISQPLPLADGSTEARGFQWQ